MWKVVFLTALLAFTGTSPAAEYCKLKQYSDGELVARESVLVIDRATLSVSEPVRLYLTALYLSMDMP